MDMTDHQDSLLGAALGALRQRAFYNAYDRTFEVVRATTDSLKEQAFRLRYQIYCEENKFMSPADYFEPMERDAFDLRAVHHLLIHVPTNTVVGTVRVLLPDETAPLTSFELQKVCDHPLLQIENRVLGLCEVSRLCMAPTFRRRPKDGHLLPAYYEQEWNEDGNRASSMPFFRRRIPYAPLGLLRAAFETMLEAGMTNGILAVEPEQSQTLMRLGFAYRLLGPRVEMQGVLQPVVFNIKAVLDSMETVNPECAEIVGDRGRLHARARALHHYDWHDSVFSESDKDVFLHKQV